MEHKLTHKEMNMNEAKDTNEYRKAWQSQINSLAGALAWDDYPRWERVKKELYEMLEARCSYLEALPSDLLESGGRKVVRS
jgi:hypothetical protein